jgi:hypothetical protein
MTSAMVPYDFLPRRGKARLRLGIPAHLLTVHGRSRVTLLDLSQSGARLQYAGERIGDGVLEWLDHEAFGSVVRRAGGEVGLRFDEPITHAWVLDTRARLPAIARTEDQLRRFAREWVRGEDRPIDPAAAYGRRDGVLPRRAFARHGGAGAPGRKSAVRIWLHAARPFVLGGLVIGIVAGYGSSFF